MSSKTKRRTTRQTKEKPEKVKGRKRRKVMENKETQTEELSEFHESLKEDEEGPGSQKTTFPLDEVDSEDLKTLKKLKISSNRREEIKRYLELYGYEENRTIIQVHLPGKMGRGIPTRAKEAAKERYGGTSFVVVGRTHDKSILDVVRKPISKGESYVGYLFKGRGKAPHELLPLDFTPTQISYPDEWRKIYGEGSGYLLTLHVPVAFIKHKNELSRAMYRIGKKYSAMDEWKFLDELEPLGVKRIKNN